MASGQRRYPLLHDLEWMSARHVEEGLHPGQIATQVGCSVVAARHALINLGIYRPLRRPNEVRVLGHLTRERMLADAGHHSSWWQLSRTYAVQRVVVHDHALWLGIGDEVQARFSPANRRSLKPLGEHPQLSSRTWIAETWAERYLLKDVVAQSGGDAAVVTRWLRHHRMSCTQLRTGRDWAICIAYQDGQPIGELAVAYRLDFSAVWQILNRSNVLIRSQRPKEAGESPG